MIKMVCRRKYLVSAFNKLSKYKFCCIFVYTQANFYSPTLGANINYDERFTKKR